MWLDEGNFVYAKIQSRKYDSGKGKRPAKGRVGTQGGFLGVGKCRSRSRGQRATLALVTTIVDESQRVIFTHGGKIWNAKGGRVADSN